MALTILDGRNGMPAFSAPANLVWDGPAVHLSDAQVADVVNYLRSHFGNPYKDDATASEVAKLPHPATARRALRAGVPIGVGANDAPAVRLVANVRSALCGKWYARDPRARCQQPLLNVLVRRCGMRGAGLQMVEILSGHYGFRVVTRCEPCLRPWCCVHIIRRARAAHLGRYPARFQGIGEHVRPHSGDRKRKNHLMQFGLCVGARSIPRPRVPDQIRQTGISPSMHS